MHFHFLFTSQNEPDHLYLYNTVQICGEDVFHIMYALNKNHELPRGTQVRYRRNGAPYKFHSHTNTNTWARRFILFGHIGKIQHPYCDAGVRSSATS